MSTTLIRRNGFVPVNPWSLLNELENQFGGRGAASANTAVANRLLGEPTSSVPPVDIYETEEAVVVVASLPGVDANNVNVEVHKGAVTISGEQASVFSPAEGANYKQHVRGIRQYGKFEFRFKLPGDIQSDKANAAYQDGILRLTFPKTPAPQPLKIAVNKETQVEAASIQAETTEA
jgi:HSP20 family protein